MFDFIIIGSGFAGSVIAERVANVLNKKVLIIEKRNHIGGNAYDYYDDKGILVHKYGPHIFHTKFKKVWDYLSNYTDWHIYHHKVLGLVDGIKVPIPFNIDTLHKVFPESFATHLEQKLVDKFGYNVKVPILELRKESDKDLNYLANFIYEKVFLNYTTKQWGIKPEDIDPSVTGRVPVYISRDSRYFQDKYQGMPKKGYTRIFENILNHPNIKLMLNADAKEFITKNEDTKQINFMGKEFNGTLVYTGMIDEFFDYSLGELPYRSLRFDFDTQDKECFQEVATVNYPNNYDFTRITEFKHLTLERNPFTTIIREYPQEYDRNIKGKDIPYYPIPKDEHTKLYEKYREKAKAFKNLIFLGRLGEYKYYNMDLIIERSLEVFEKEISGS